MVVLYGITLAPLLEDLLSSDPVILTPLHADDMAFDGLVRRNAQILNLLMERGPYWGYFPKPAKKLFIIDSPD